VGAGTGSYEPAGVDVVAVDPSAVMIAQRPRAAAPAVLGVAEHLPFASGQFDAAMAVLTIHHWRDVREGLAEMCRVSDRVVVLTFDYELHGSFWLFEEYLPESNALRSTRSPAPDLVAEMIDADRVEVVAVPADCFDGFNWAYWRRPHAYLDPDVRACISGLAQLPGDLVASRMEQLRSDLDDGTWHARHRDLLDLDGVDGGFRLIVRG
jgi:SAM-dependent methyltransferase